MESLKTFLAELFEKLRLPREVIEVDMKHIGQIRISYVDDEVENAPSKHLYLHCVEKTYHFQYFGCISYSKKYSTYEVFSDIVEEDNHVPWVTDAFSEPVHFPDFLSSSLNHRIKAKSVLNLYLSNLLNQKKIQ